MSERADDPRLLEIAKAIADGTPIDWAGEEEKSGPINAAIVGELRALQALTRFHNGIPERWGTFSIVGELGSGAFGVVYQARQADLDLDVALKVIHPPPGRPFDPERALREARLMARINHPNVVRVFDATRIDDEVGVAMELVSGDTLDEIVKRHGPFNAREAALLGIDLCRALAAVHAADALHGDIKAHNVMRASGGRTVLMDFGTAKDLLVSRPPGAPDFAGTPLYMAPELFAGTPRSRASDIYSLGVLLFYLVTGTYPVDGATCDEVAAKHGDQQPARSLRAARPDLPEPFVQTIERALSFRPEDRFESAGQFEAALANAGSARWPRAALLLAAAAGIVLSVIVAARWATAPAATGGNASATAGGYRVEAGLYRYRNGGIETRVAPTDRLAIDDQLFLQVSASVPAYVYLVNEDDEGETYLLYPLPGQDAANPLPAGAVHRLPGTVKGEDLAWKVTTAGRREHFLVFVSPSPSPEFDRMFARLPHPGGDRAPLATHLSPPDRDALRSVGGLSPAPQPVGRVDLQLRNVPEFSTPLPAIPETAHGVWVRRLSVANPAN